MTYIDNNILEVLVSCSILDCTSSQISSENALSWYNPSKYIRHSITFICILTRTLTFFRCYSFKTSFPATLLKQILDNGFTEFHLSCSNKVLSKMLYFAIFVLLLLSDFEWINIDIRYCDQTIYCVRKYKINHKKGVNFRTSWSMLFEIDSRVPHTRKKQFVVNMYSNLEWINYLLNENSKLTMILLIKYAEYPFSIRISSLLIITTRVRILAHRIGCGTDSLKTTFTFQHYWWLEYKVCLHSYHVMYIVF